MDQRVIDLWDRLMAYGESGSAPLPAIRDEVLELHEAITDEESRLGLMRIFNLVCDLVAVHLQETNGDLKPSPFTGRARYGCSCAPNALSMACWTGPDCSM